MSTYVDKPISLVERKKQQWAKEREELAGLCGPWGPVDTQPYERPFGRTRYDPKLSMVNNTEYLRTELRETSRRSSLPPLYKNQYNSHDRYEKDLGGETSGYGSDNPNANLTPEYQKWNHQSGYESSSSFRDDRPKWDKGVGVGKFWHPSKQESFEKTTPGEPPNWVKRGLQDGEIVVSNTSPAESPQQTYEEPERPCTSSSTTLNRSYIRGQNIPMDSVELAERERRRQIAMEHQEAVRQQLEERERRRREEREQRIKEEQEEELRIEREQEIERKRKEEEQRILKEKLEKERKRKEAIQEALEIAEKEAKLEKMKLRMMKHSNNNIINMNMLDNVVEKEKIMQGLEDSKEVSSNIQTEDRKSNNCEPLNNSNVRLCEIINNEINNNLEIKGKSLVSPRENLPASTETLNNNRNATPVLSPRADSLALVLQNPLDHLQNIQYALIMPNLGNTNSPSIPIAVPIAFSSPSHPTSTARTENRILTPTQYRNKNRKTCDSSTQTEDLMKLDSENREKYLREKLTNLELTYDNRRKESRRSRNEDRRSESMEERPKWGANRPPTRYLKQSEKDPLYQRRKLRQKSRGDSKGYSSDDSPTATPRSYRKKSYVEKRHTRSLWRKDDQIFSRNIKMYQTEIVPLEVDKDQIYYKKFEHECCCHCKCERHKYSRDNNVKVDILKIEHNSPRESFKVEMMQGTETLPDCTSTTNESSSDILDKLSSLHNGLMLKQEQWENSPRTPSLSSATTRH